jgi:predicted aldo/keto reductase-like oxidoreductase
MRLPVVDGENKNIDMDASREMVAYALKNGINYFDTAWGYHDGKSEPAMGELLSEHPRESFYLASKFPGFNANLMERVEEIFEKQLERCKTDYFDFYLFHCVCESNIDGYLDEKYGIFNYLMKQKANGRIKHLGFSAHASMHTLRRFLDAYGKDMEFCQLQINWLDWKLQQAKEKVALVTSYGIPVWVMEPVRGGRLASIAPEHEARLRALRPNATVPEWAFRFLQGIPEVVMTLSGMSNFDQLKENIATYATKEPLNGEEMATLLDISDKIIASTAVPCTGCKYCTTHCPMTLDIPEILKAYNEYTQDKSKLPEGLTAIEEAKWPAACIGCRSCEEMCPQGIKISEVMADFAAKLGK